LAASCERDTCPGLAVSRRPLIAKELKQFQASLCRRLYDLTTRQRPKITHCIK